MENKPVTYDGSMPHILNSLKAEAGSLNEAQAGTLYLPLRKLKVDVCQGFVQLPGFADKKATVR